MDEGKDFLGTAGTQNANAFDSSTQPPTHPANSIPPSDSTSTPPIISSANIAPPTPLTAPLPTDPLHPTQSVASGSGDIVVGRGNLGFNKKWLIFGAVALAVVIVFIATISLLTSGRNPELSRAFMEYYQRLALGPSDNVDSGATDATDEAADEDDEGMNIDDVEEIDGEDPTTEAPTTETSTDVPSSADDWFIFAANSLLTDEEYINYTAELQASYDNFFSVLENSDINDLDYSLEQAQFQHNALDFILIYLRLSNIETELTESYQTGGRSSARALIEQRISYEGEVVNIENLEDHDEEELLEIGIFDSAYSALQEYLEQELAVLDVYSENNCLSSDEGVNSSCVATLYDTDNPSYLSSLESRSVYYDNLFAFYDAIKDAFQSSVTEFYEELSN